MIINYIKANKHNYGGRRLYSSVKYIIIHYTGNKGDTAENNAEYFSKRLSTPVSAHFFVDQKGGIYKSVPMNFVAYSVGGRKYDDCSKTGGGKYYGVATNRNSVSIELCDNATRDPSAAQINAVVNVIRYIRTYCKSAKVVIRHFDVNGKHCPLRMTSSKKWNTFKKEIKEV